MCPRNGHLLTANFVERDVPKNFLTPTPGSRVWMWISVGIKTQSERRSVKNKVIQRKYTVQDC